MKNILIAFICYGVFIQSLCRKMDLDVCIDILGSGYVQNSLGSVSYLVS